MRARARLVGRQPSLEHLDRALASAASGAGSVQLLLGEAGIGKTRLAEELATIARERGVDAVWGRAWEAGGAPAYWPWVEVLRALLRRHGVDALFPLARRRVIAQILPELRGDDEPVPGELPPDQARFVLLEALVTTLCDAARLAPLLVVIDDAHAADRGTLLVLELLQTQVRTARALIVVTARPTPLRTEATGPVLARLARLAETTELARLSRDDVRTLLQEMDGDRDRAAATSEARLDDLYATCEGNPLFLLELARWLDTAERGTARGGSARALPQGIRAVIAQRRDAISEQARQLIEVGTIFGREFSTDVVLAVAGMGASEGADARIEAIDAAILEPAGDQASRFTHVLLRDALYAEIPERRRQALHERAAAALSSLPIATPPWSEIAHHLFQAGAEHLVRATFAARSAAEQASSQLAFDDAVTWLERALEAERKLGDTSPTAEGELMLELARARSAAGDVSGARDLCRRAADAARASDDVHLFARAALESGRVFVFGNVDEGLVTLIDEALATLPPSEVGVRARLVARRAAALQPGPDPEALIASAREAVTLARTVGDDAVLLETLRSAAATMADLGDPRERAVVNEEIVSIAHRLRDTFAELRASSRLAFDLYEIGDAAAADDVVARMSDLAERLDAPHVRWIARGLVSMRSFHRGELGEAERISAEAAALGERARDTNARHAVAIQRLARHHVLRDFDALLAELPGLRRGVGEFHMLGMWLDALEVSVRGHAQGASLTGRERELLEYAIGVGDTALLSFVAERAARTRDAELAARVERSLLRRSGHLATWGILGLCIGGPIDGLLGMLDFARGRLDSAIGRLEAGLALVRRTGGKPHEVTSGLDLAAALRARGGAGDAERAGRLEADATSLATALGMKRPPSVLAPVEPLAPPPAEQRPAPRPAPLAMTLSLRADGETWVLEHDGGALRLEDAKGVRYLAELLAAPGKPLHVLELVSPEAAEIDRGDAGEILDAKSIAAYRARVRELREWLDDDGGGGGPDDARDRARSELEAIEDQLLVGLGLGGRARRASSSVERARVNVQRRIKDSLRRIEALSPSVGKYLARAVRTGVFCTYDP